MKNPLLVIILCLFLAASGASVLYVCSHLGDEDPIDFRWLHVQEDGKLKIYLQWWDGEEWKDVPVVKNEDLEE